MGKIGWRFAPLSGGTRQGYTNNDIEGFKGEKLFDNLAREICQNSLDARLKSTEPVKVAFELKYFPKNKYKVFTEYKKCLEGCHDYWDGRMDKKLERFLSNAEHTLENDFIPVLIARDYNTTGLNGSRSEEVGTSWEALTGSDGFSVKADDSSGGSYGIGKNAPFACSSLSMVFYNTVAEDGQSAFIGVSRLATLKINGKDTQRIGKYQNNDDDNEVWLPIYREDRDQFRDCFVRNEKGTDVIIAGFTQPSGWMANVEKAVLKNFFVAISEGLLVVELKEGENKKTIGKNDLERLFEDLADDKKMAPTSQLYKAFTNPDITKKTEVIEPDDVEVYIKTDSSYQKKIANFRETGMLIKDYSRNIFQHYAAVVVVRGRKLGELLRDTEPPRHNKWDYKQIEEPERRRDARKAIGIIDDYVLNLLRSQYETVTEEEVDAAGVAEYLPDEMPDEAGPADQSTGDDILRPKIKIGEMRRRNQRPATVVQPGMQNEGAEQENGDIHNHRRNPNATTQTPPVLIDPDSDILDQQEGIGDGDGSKTVQNVYLGKQRAFPLSSSQGLYKIIAVPEESHEKLYVECFALGENGKLDPLDMERFVADNRRIGISGRKAGPLTLEAGKAADFIVTFSQKEKMQLRLRLTEVIEK